MAVQVQGHCMHACSGRDCCTRTVRIEGSVRVSCDLKRSTVQVVEQKVEKLPLVLLPCRFVLFRAGWTVGFLRHSTKIMFVFVV